jgi:hypothetical protein
MTNKRHGPGQTRLHICLLLLFSQAVVSCAVFEDNHRECVVWETRVSGGESCIQENQNGDCIEHADDSESREICVESMCKEGYVEGSDGKCVEQRF